MKKKNSKTLRKYAVALVVSLVIGVSVYSLNARLVSRDSMPMPFGVGVSVILSGSMEPELSVGDLVVVTRDDDYAVGDVVVFQSGSMLVAHRIIEIDGDTVTTQGDANNTADDPMDKKYIKGEVGLAIPLVGYAVSFVKSTAGTVLILGLAAYLLYRSFANEKREQSEEHSEELEEIRREIEKLKKEKESR